MSRIRFDLGKSRSASQNRAHHFGRSRQGRAQGSGRRGFIYTIDATLALFLMVLVLMTTIFLSYQAESNPYAKLHMVRQAKDVLFAMDRQGMLSGGNQTLIESTLNSTLPGSIGAHLQVYTYYKDVSGFNLVEIKEYGQGQPDNTSIYGARRDFVSMKNGMVVNYSIARMTIWQK